MTIETFLDKVIIQDKLGTYEHINGDTYRISFISGYVADFNMASPMVKRNLEACSSELLAVYIDPKDLLLLGKNKTIKVEAFTNPVTGMYVMPSQLTAERAAAIESKIDGDDVFNPEIHKVNKNGKSYKSKGKYVRK